MGQKKRCWSPERCVCPTEAHRDPEGSPPTSSPPQKGAPHLFPGREPPKDRTCPKALAQEFDLGVQSVS